jgi:glycosyltransferase involved in cell wall biosynthesis
MRILQIIDSLDVGGAEKMAINYANSLANATAFSGLVATRKEGNLKSQLNKNVDYLFLNRKNTFDFGSILRLKNYCKKNRIDHLQAHSSSFFTAFLVKILYPKINIIWHDHNGLSEFLNTRKSVALKIASYFFKGIVVVNYQLKQWAEKTLNCKNVLYLANFTNLNVAEIKTTSLKGIAGKRILCLANLRFQKNHFLLIEVARKLKVSHPDWTFHLVGKDFEDDYSEKVKNAITENNLSDSVFIYGSKDDVQNCIEQAEICILTSQSEGLPVALLEYGLNKKPVVSTEVGEIPLIIKNEFNGFIVPKFDAENFYLSLVKLIASKDLRSSLGEQLYETLMKNNSEEAVIKAYLNWLKEMNHAE